MPARRIKKINHNFKAAKAAFFMQEHHSQYGQHPVVLFDGLCNLCNGFVQFVLRRDPDKQFRFASLQSAYGQDLMNQFGIVPGALNSVYLLESGQLFSRSTAALRIAGKLSGGWKLLSVLRFVPVFIRDGVYDAVAKNRYRWFGKRETCLVPSAETRDRFMH